MLTLDLGHSSIPEPAAVSPAGNARAVQNSTAIGSIAVLFWSFPHFQLCPVLQRVEPGRADHGIQKVVK
jgi:hypothetical protein